MDFTNQYNHAHVQKSLSLNYRCEPMQSLTHAAAEHHLEVAVIMGLA